MKYAGAIALLLLLIALVIWDIMLRIDETEKPAVFPSKTAEDIHDLKVFQNRVSQIVNGHKEENQKPEHTAAIAAVGLERVLVISDRGHTQNAALQEAWNTIEIIRSIHGDDGPETTYLYHLFFAYGPFLGQMVEMDVLLPILESAWTTAKVPDRLNLLSIYGKKDALCNYINQQIDVCDFILEQLFVAGNPDKSQSYLNRMEAIMNLPWIETLYETKENRVGTLGFDYLADRYDMAKARVLILNQKYPEAVAHLEGMGFPKTPDQDPLAAEVWMPLYEGWHLTDPEGGHDEPLRTWATGYLSHAEEQYSSAAGLKDRRADWKQKADDARATLERLHSSE